MQIELANVSPRRQRLKSAPAQALVDDFVQRAGRYTPVSFITYATEEVLLAALDRTTGRAASSLCLLDSRGEALTSLGFSERLAKLRDGGTQRWVVAVGPADGWSEAAWKRAETRLAFGAATLPHELALVLAAEQVYRALTILAGHPYHCGH